MNRLLYVAVLLVLAVPASAQGVPSGGRLVVESVPRGALVYVDGSQSGRAPVTVAVPAGQRLVRVLYNGYEPFEQAVSVQEGDTVHVTAALTPQTGVVSVRGLPAGTSVAINGAPADGATAVPIGEARVDVTLPSGRTLRAVVPVRPGAETGVVYGDRVRSTRTALFALLVPGGAQIRGGRAVPGVALALGTAAGLGVAFAADRSASGAQTRMDDALAVYGAAQTEGEAVAAYADAERESGRRDRAQNVRTGALATAATVALASALDAFVHHVRGPGLSVVRPLRPAVGLYGPVVRLAVSF
jgi:hypothetical protein